MSREGELLILFLRLKIRKYKLRDFLAGRSILAKCNAERQHSNYNTILLGFLF